jgi:hypothetical protein
MLPPTIFTWWQQIRYVGRELSEGVVVHMLGKAWVGPADAAEILIFMYHDGERYQSGVQRRVSAVFLKNPPKFKYSAILYQMQGVIKTVKTPRK